MPKSDLHHAPLEVEGDNNIANTNNDRHHVPKSDRCREEEGDITNDRRQRHRPGTSGDEKLKKGHHPFSNIGIVDTNIPPLGDAYWDDCEDDDDSGEDEEIPNAAVATAASNPRRRSNPNGAVADEGGVATAASDPRRLRTSSNEEDDTEGEDEEGVIDELFSESETKSNDDSEDSRSGDDTEEREDEAGVDSSSYGSSDEENRANRKKDGRFGPNEAKKKAASKRRAKDYEEGLPNGTIAHVQKLKLTNVNVAHRSQLVLNGEKRKSGNYSVGWDVSDPRPEARYWFVKGKRPDLEDFGKDVAIPGASNTGLHSWFNKAKKALTKPPKKGKTNRVIFKTYEEGDDIPDGCQANHSLPKGPLPKSRQNEIFTYYFYHPEFDHKYDAQGLAPYMKADSSDSSDSNSSDSDSDSF